LEAEIQRQKAAASAAAQAQLAAREQKLAEARRLHARGQHFVIKITDAGAQAKFMARCDTTEKFKTVKHVAVFDGGFFLSRDNDRSTWSTLPGSLGSYLQSENRNIEGEVQYVAGGSTGAYYAMLNDEVCWSTQGLQDEDDFEAAVRKYRVKHVEFGENGCWIVLYEGGRSAWSRGLPRELFNKLRSRNPRLPEASQVTLGPYETWFVRWADGKTDWCLPTHVSKLCDDVVSAGGEVTHVSLFSAGNYFIRSTVWVPSVPESNYGSDSEPAVSESNSDSEPEVYESNSGSDSDW
jgi:hypothetical protein